MPPQPETGPVEFRPAPELADRVARFWVRHPAPGAVLPGSTTILPDGCNDFVARFRARPGGGYELSDLRVVGTMTRPMRVELEGEVGFVGVRLRPHAARCLLDAPASQVTDRVLSAGLLRPRESERLCNEVLQVPDLVTALAGLTRFVAALGADRPPDPRVRTSVRRLLATRGACSVGTLAADAGLTRQHFTRLFAAEVGLSPKRFARVARFRAALDVLRGAPAGSSASVAVELGYFDQAHMARDFREIGGSTPGQHGITLRRRPPGT